MIPSCFPCKVVIFFGKEHVNRSSISGVMIGRSWTIKFGKCKFSVPKHQFWVFQNRFFNFCHHNSTNAGPIDMFFTKKYSYFSWETRWNYPFLFQPPLKGCFGTWAATFFCRYCRGVMHILVYQIIWRRSDWSDSSIPHTLWS